MFPTDTPFTVFDTETTGLDPRRGDRIIEIAGVRVEDGKIIKEQSFVSLVDPECSISPEANRVHGISNEDLVGAPTIGDVLPKFLAFAEGSILIAHNAEFDLGFLEAEKEMCWGYVEIPECLCTMVLSRAVTPHEYRHNLNVLSQRLGLTFPEDRHRALPDVLLTAQALLKLIEIGNIHSLEELREKATPKLVAWR